MNKTLFSEKCQILGDLWLYYREDAERNELWEEFFFVNDVALPLSYMITANLAIVSGDGEAEKLIDETWTMLCEYLGVDPEGWYTSLMDIFNASPNERME